MKQQSLIVNSSSIKITFLKQLNMNVPDKTHEVVAKESFIKVLHGKLCSFSCGANEVITILRFVPTSRQPTSWDHVFQKSPLCQWDHSMGNHFSTWFPSLFSMSRHEWTQKSFLVVSHPVDDHDERIQWVLSWST